MTGEEYLEQNPCWCGRPAVEVISRGTPDGEQETRGYCHLHAEKTTTTVVRRRQDGPQKIAGAE